MPLTGKQLQRITTTLAALVALAGAAACGGDDNGGGDNGGGTGLPASTTYAGLYATSTGSTGPVNLTFASAVSAPPVHPASASSLLGASSAPIAVTGTVQVGSTTIPINGTLDGTTLSMTGDGGLAIDGTLDHGVITGTFTIGEETGTITAASSSEGTPAHAYCGNFEGTIVGEEDPDFGTFSAVIAGTVVSGVVVGDGGTTNTFKGTATPSGDHGTFTIHQTVGEGTLIVDDGVYDSEGTSGTYTTKVGSTTAGSGDFSGLIDCPQAE